MLSEGILILKCEGRAIEIVESWVKIKGTTTYVLQTMDESLEYKLLKKNVCLYIIWRNIKLALSRLWKFVCILQSLQQPEKKFNSYWILIYGYGCV